MVPGDPARVVAGDQATPELLQQVRVELGLQEPFLMQYVAFLRRIARGNLGFSYLSQKSVLEEVTARYGATLELASAAILLAVVTGVAAGVVSSVFRYGLLDKVFMLVALGGVSIPVFWLGLMLILFFSLHLGWLPAVGRGGVQFLVLPAVTLGARSSGVIARITRGSMLEVLNRDFVRTARSKGCTEPRVVLRHALHNALIPVITIVGLEFGYLLAGAVVTETVFAWPGIGLYIVDSIRARDFPGVQGAALVIATSFLAINLVVDVLYACADPRIRAE
jgi:ABC-type dipeptide/oligopeptide/nickel transport system permease component